MKYYQLKVITPCGTSIYHGYAYNSYGCSGSNEFMAYPNPAKDEIVIFYALDEVNDKLTIAKEQVEKEEKEFTANLYNQFNENMKNAESNNGKITFDVKDLPNGIYYLHIHNSEEIKRSQIIIER